MKMKIAYFITPHGFGHAARASAVMNSLNSLRNNLEFEIFTEVPAWFFVNSGITNFNYNEHLTDIGLVQKSALEEDLKQTIIELNDFLPFDEELIISISNKLKESECQIVICDISPLGIICAQNAGIRSILIENFTWDWIYSQYENEDKSLSKHIEYLNKIYRSADHIIKTKPFCFQSRNDLITNPVSRRPRTSSAEMKKLLNIPESKKIVIITMGGIEFEYNFLENLKSNQDIYFIIPGSSSNAERISNLILLPHNSGLYHPDLINASNAVIGKVGYSTLAEVYNSGVPFSYILRPQFPESTPMHEFIVRNMKAVEIDETELYSNSLNAKIEKLLSFSKEDQTKQNGADQATQFINSLI